jgi:hypothetical protein
MIFFWLVLKLEISYGELYNILKDFWFLLERIFFFIFEDYIFAW